MPDDSALVSQHASAADQPADGQVWEWQAGSSVAAGSAEGAIHGSADRAAWARHRRRIEVSRASREDRSLRRMAYKTALSCFSAGLQATGLAALGRKNARAISLSTVSAVFPHLPEALQGLRILFVADPHFDCLENFDQRVINRVRGLNCDLLICGGDYRYGTAAQFTEKHTMDALARLREAVNVELGSFAILGNHDSADMAPGIEKAGFNLLVNETAVVPVGDATLSLTGTDDVYSYPTQNALDALARGALVPSDFSLALVHSPDLADEAAQAGHHLYLCGHTHGGQICLPGGKPVIMPLSRNRHLGAGQWQHGAMQGYTSRGVGTSTLPYRFNCPPEIVAFTLRKH